MTAAALAPLGATPFAGLVPWLASLWRRLRAAVARRVAARHHRARLASRRSLEQTRTQLGL